MMTHDYEHVGPNMVDAIMGRQCVTFRSRATPGVNVTVWPLYPTLFPNLPTHTRGGATSFLEPPYVVHYNWEFVSRGAPMRPPPLPPQRHAAGPGHAATAIPSPRRQYIGSKANRMTANGHWYSPMVPPTPG